VSCRLCPHAESMHGPFGCSECPCIDDFGPPSGQPYEGPQVRKRSLAPGTPAIASSRPREATGLREMARRMRAWSEELDLLADQQERQGC
jgi:hypothetical protein